MYATTIELFPWKTPLSFSNACFYLTGEDAEPSPSLSLLQFKSAASIHVKKHTLHLMYVLQGN